MHAPTLSPSFGAEFYVRLTRKGQLTLPAAVRRFLGLGSDDKVSLIVHEVSKTVELRVPRYPTISSLAGAAGKLDRPVPWQEMFDTARAEALLKKNTAEGNG